MSETLAAEILIKQPSESLQYTMDFSNVLENGETISSCTSVTATPSGLTIGAAAVGATSVAFRISGGEDGVNYRVEVIVATNQSNTRESDGLLKVRD